MKSKYVRWIVILFIILVIILEGYNVYIQDSVVSFKDLFTLGNILIILSKIVSAISTPFLLGSFLIAIENFKGDEIKVKNREDNLRYSIRETIHICNENYDYLLQIGEYLLDENYDCAIDLCYDLEKKGKISIPEGIVKINEKSQIYVSINSYLNVVSKYFLKEPFENNENSIVHLTDLGFDINIKKDYFDLKNVYCRVVRGLSESVCDEKNSNFKEDMVKLNDKLKLLSEKYEVSCSIK